MFILWGASQHWKQILRGGKTSFLLVWEVNTFSLLDPLDSDKHGLSVVVTFQNTSWVLIFEVKKVRFTHWIRNKSRIFLMRHLQTFQSTLIFRIHQNKTSALKIYQPSNSWILAFVAHLLLNILVLPLEVKSRHSLSREMNNKTIRFTWCIVVRFRAFFFVTWSSTMKQFKSFKDAPVMFHSKINDLMVSEPLKSLILFSHNTITNMFQGHILCITNNDFLHTEEKFTSLKISWGGLKGLGLHVRNTNCCYTVTKFECLKSRYRSQVLNTYDNIKHWSLLTYWFLLWFQTIMCTPPWKTRWTDNKNSGFTPVQEPRLATLAIPHLSMWALLGVDSSALPVISSNCLGHTAETLISVEADTAA